MNFVAIILYDGKPLGSGFVLDRSIALTCFHVLAAGIKPFMGYNFQLKFIQAPSQPVVNAIATSSAAEQRDVALLRLLDPLPPSIQPPRLVDAPVDILVGKSFQTMGYGVVNDKQHSYEFMPAYGSVVGIASRDGLERIQLNSQNILRGMSGAPVFVPDVGGIVGMITARYMIDPNLDLHNRDTAWAVKAAHLAAVDSSIQLYPPDIPPSQSAESGEQRTIYNFGNGSIATDHGRIIQQSGGTYVEGNATFQEKDKDQS